jgi:hypothetical protein
MHKFTWTTPDRKTQNKIDHILTHRRRHSSILDIRSFRAEDCDTDHYLVVTTVRERLAVSKQEPGGTEIKWDTSAAGLWR